MVLKRDTQTIIISNWEIFEMLNRRLTSGLITRKLLMILMPTKTEHRSVETFMLLFEHESGVEVLNVNP